MSSTNQQLHSGSRFDHLDGVRGLMALWVMCSHQCTAIGAVFPVLSSNVGTAVDVFIMLSGFFMVLNYQRQISSESDVSPRTWSRFWIRRLFRIAPVYYVCYLATFAVLPILLGYQHELASIYKHPWMLDPGPPESWPAYPNFKSLLAHLTFVFGMLPQYAAMDVLPDWSLSLEAQYYFVFPFLMLFWRRTSTVSLVTLGVAILGVTHLFLWTGAPDAPHARWATTHFQMQSFLGFKLHLFIVGMLLAEALRLCDERKFAEATLSTALAGLLCGASGGKILALGFVVLALCILGRGTSGRASAFLIRFLSLRPMVILGELSYAVYLAHEPILIAISRWLSQHQSFLDLSPVLRFSLALALAVPLVAVVSLLLHRAVEKPGIQLGKMLVKRI